MMKPFRILILLALLMALPGCRPAQKKPVVVFAAGSMITPFAELERAFEASNPDLDLLMEYHGSIQVMRHVTDIHEKIDVVATADTALIPSLMYAQNDPDTGKPFADWYIQFASNRLAIAYSPASKYSAEVNAQNWTEVLARPGVRVGIADPRFDAAGYRALLVYKLAETVYQQRDLFYDRFNGQFTQPIKVKTQDGVAVIRVPEIVEPKKDSQIVLRGASIELIALLESGDLDYAFEYESVIRQHNLPWIALPPELNLGEEELESEYGRAAVRLDFQRFASVRPEFKGERIRYGITIPVSAPNPAGGERFIAFLLSAEGRQIMEHSFHPLFDPPTADHPERLPERLRELTTSRP